MKLIQIPFSHNCVKVRVALGLKEIPYETQDIAPMDRAPFLPLFAAFIAASRIGRKRVQSM